MPFPSPDPAVPVRRNAPSPRFLAVAALLVLIGTGLWTLDAKRPRPSSDPLRFSFLAMGTIGEIAVSGAPADVAAAVADAAQARIAALEEDYSAFRPDSLVSRLNSGEQVRIPDDGQPLFHIAFRVAEASGGAFDPTVGPLLKAWGLRGKVPVEPPGQDALSNTLAHVGWRRVHCLSGDAGKTELSVQCEDGTELDFGGVAKGFAVDEASEAALYVLKAAGLRDAGLLVNLGGNMRAFGRPRPGVDGWTIAIRDPFLPYGQGSAGTLLLSNGLATATSGSYERFIDIGGERFSHIVDPRTGHPVRGVAQATVLAPTAAEADALSTACFVLGAQTPESLLAAFPGTEVRFVFEDGSFETLPAQDGP